MFTLTMSPVKEVCNMYEKNSRPITNQACKMQIRNKTRKLKGSFIFAGTQEI